MAADRFAAAIANTLFGPDEHIGANLMRVAVRLLAHGKPVTVTELATAAGVEVADLPNAPAGQDIEYDEQHRIIGWGLTLSPTPHTYIVNGHHLYTWCAADTLLFPAILGAGAQIESPCPTTDTVIRLTVDPQTRVSDLSPGTAVISIPGSPKWTSPGSVPPPATPAVTSPAPRPPTTGSPNIPTGRCARRRRLLPTAPHQQLAARPTPNPTS